MEQVQKQAIDSAKAELLKCLQSGEHGRITIIGEQRVQAVVTGREY